MIIAIDGPSAAGKGTLARGIAKALGYHFLDTGALYRMVGLQMIREGTEDPLKAVDIARSLDPGAFKDNELRTEDVAGRASVAAAIPAVRQALLEFQRGFAKRPPGAVLDGRDIGTVVCPNAELKFFVTASTQVRAQRRFDELKASGKSVPFEQVLDELRTRDERDASRATAPTLAAEDAILIDTSELDASEVLAAVMDVVRDAQSSR